MNFLWSSNESQSVGCEMRGQSRRLCVEGLGHAVCTDEELEHAWILDLSAPVASLETILLRNGGYG